MPSSPFALLDPLLAPAPAAARVAFLKAQPFAHRGLHGGAAIENGRQAFEAAIARGHGIECDVQASRDGHAIVFHDWTLERLTTEAGPVAGRSLADLARIGLGGGGGGGGDRILPLPELLALVRGRVPLLIEIKQRGRRVGPLCLSVRRALDGYRGPAAVMSFNPEAVRWFHAHAPRIVRGLVASDSLWRRGWRGRIERRLALWRAAPEFLAWDVRDLPSRFVAAQRARGLPVVSWTVRTAADRATAAAGADQPVYEAA